LSQLALLRTRVGRRLPALSSFRGPRPARGHEVAGGREARHVDGDLRHDDLSDDVTDPGDRREEAPARSSIGASKFSAPPFLV
jgi:hypothetical protein